MKEKICVLLIGLIFLIGCAQKNVEKHSIENMTTTTLKNVRKSVIAGSWYPGSEEELKTVVDGYLSRAEKQDLGKIRALVSPHAGYTYSGQVAAFSYKQIQERDYDKVIIMAPSHHYAFYGASIGDYTHYETPLGEVPVSPIADQMMKESSLVSSISKAHLQEHSLEIQLPFLQRSLDKFDIVPIVIGKLSDDDIDRFADLIIKHLDDKTLIVASSDLSHYHPYDIAVQKDTTCINSIISLNLSEAKKCEMCGYYPILVTMQIAQKLGWKTRLLKYANSGDVTGDSSAVVGYTAIAFYSNESSVSTVSEELNEEEQKFLLNLARESLETYIREGRKIQPETDNPKLKGEKGTFVTLEKNGQLRGCIGHIIAIQPLYLDVRDNAINAAVNDPRFRPVTEDELDDIEIEVSVLTKPEVIEADSPEEYLEKIKQGIDGIIIEYSGRSATYLPQVWEQIPDKEEFLEHLCEKAFLPSNCWRQKEVKIYKYRVQTFKESDFE